jgi:putative transcriptional regulator
MAIVRYTLDPDNPPRFTEAEKARLDALIDEQIIAAAESDPDNPPLTDEQLALMGRVKHIQRARRASGLTQEAFARTYHISLGRLRDLEQGRTEPDSALKAYLTLIRYDPEGVRRQLEAAAERAA